MHCWNFNNPSRRKKELFSLKGNENKSNCKDSAKILFNVLSALEEWNGTDVMKRSVSTWRCIEWWKCSKSLRVLICQNEAGSRPVARLMFVAERWQLAIQKWCDDNTHFYLIDIRNADVGRKSNRKSLGKRRPRERKWYHFLVVLPKVWCVINFKQLIADRNSRKIAQFLFFLWKNLGSQ